MKVGKIIIKREMKMMKLLVILYIVSVFVLAGQVEAYPEGVSGIPSYVKTPDTLAEWFQEEFTYVFEFNESWRSPEEMIRQKQGDCEDFALLASRILTGWGIENEVIVVNFRGLSVGHAICAWENKGGTISFISNAEIKHTSEKTIEGAISRYYPDWERITSVDGKMNHTGVVAMKR